MKSAISIILSLFCGILFCSLAFMQLKAPVPGSSLTIAALPPAASPEPKKDGWLEKDAEYCLIVRHNVPNKDGFLDFRKICVPGQTSNGLRVYDSKNRSVSVHQYDSDHLLFPGTPAQETYSVYYGFPKPQPVSRWDGRKRRIPNNFRLRQQDVMRRYPDHPSEINRLENMKRNIPFLRAQRELWRAIGAVFVEQAALMEQICSGLTPDLKKLNGISGRNYFLSVKKQNRKAESANRNAANLLEETFFSHFGNRNWGHNVSRIFFTRRPFDTDRNLLTCFSGMLSIEEDGEYEFRLNTNSTRIFRVNGKTVLRRFGQFQAPNTDSIGTVDEITLPLKHGSNFIEFLYYKGPITNWAALSWRKKGEAKFHLMSEDDFAPASPVEPVKMISKKGEKFPIVQRNDSLALFTEKYNPYSLDHYRVLNGKQFAYHWEADGEKIDSSVEYFALKTLTEPVLRIVPDENSGFAPFTVTRKARVGDKAPLRPDLSMKIWSPYFLYDDEYGNITLEINSGLPIDYIAMLKARVAGENPYMASFAELLRIPAMPMEHDDRFAKNQISKKYFHVDGKGIRNRFTADFSISIPKLEFDSCGITAAPVKELPELTTSANGLCDKDGRKVMVILHRMSLHEVRAWELLKKIENELRPVTKLLVVAEDFNGLKEKLEARLKQKNIQLEFVEWSKLSLPSGSAALETVPSVLSHLKKSTADAALLIPLALNRHGTLGMREEMNVIAMIAELFINQKNIRSVFLSTPFPLSPKNYEIYAETDRVFGGNLRKLKREKGLRFIELDALLRKNPAWTAEAYFTNGEKTKLPYGLTEDSVEIIASEIEGK